MRPGRNNTEDGSLLFGQAGAARQNAWGRLVLVDEMFRVSQDLLGLMSIRGRQAIECRTLGGDNNRPRGIFGGLNFILAGDLMQLPPVGGTRIRAERPGPTGHAIEIMAVWLGMNACIEPTEVMRQ